MNSCSTENTFFSSESDHGLIELNFNSSIDCVASIYISQKIEPNEYYNIELRKYIYNSFIGSDSCKNSQNLDSLFIRPSFEKTILMFYKDTNLYKYNPFETRGRWENERKNLLYNCDNYDVLHLLTDSLLSYDCIDGLEVLWENVEPDRLNELLNYQQRQKSNWYVQATIAAIYRIKCMKNSYDTTLEILSKNDNYSKKYKELDTFFKRDSVFSYMEFSEILYSGYP